MNSHQSSFDEIGCPNCGEKIPVTEVIYHQIAERTREELKCESAEQQAVLSEKIRNLQLREAELDRLVEERVNAGQARVEQEALNKARQLLAIEIEDLRAQSNEKAELLAASQRAELELRKKAREFEERERALSVEVQRKLDEGRALIEEQIASRLQEQYHLRDAEKDKKLRDAGIANDLLRRKLEQGSQQTQGEVLELELEGLIRSAFPLDQIEPVPKGVTGADVLQRVINRSGHLCGMILWELKRTKAWSEGWIQKLKDDQRSIKADLAMLVTEALPKDCNNFTQINGVWVTSSQCAINLAIALRGQLIEVAVTKLAAVGKNEKMEFIYQYLSGPEFKQRIESIMEAFNDMQSDLQEERRITERRWAKREKQLQRVIFGTAGMYGDFQGLIGSSLQSIAALTDSTENRSVDPTKD
ncbi:DUF2130 domain-containing protein [Bradyrhizobium sp. CSA112]|uniref:DUF2130 domain-containing protein n=1 Tax=Bradyrhizobium sp. CSA112 TaxID=2699170 RepID=UPI0023AF439A|nr:DUF2130 domain-containing protein [Bradyrhizobium sp. CSA112]MDE5457248.1 DUF2130 domain-containing protein [Bradyrhizobium sp. CSA112]